MNKAHTSSVSCTAILSFCLSIVISHRNNANAAEGQRPDGIPPHIWEEMDMTIRTAARPVFAVIHRDDIFRLDRNSTANADVVRFDFDARNLSTAEHKALTEWLINSSIKVYLEGKEVVKYCGSSYARGGFKLPVNARDVSGTLLLKATAKGMAPHVVNTGCTNLIFHQDSYPTGYGGIEKTFMPVSSQTIIVEGGVVVVGCFSVGKSTVFFKGGVPHGNDTSRWDLNFWHWVLGRPVPGAPVGNQAVKSLTSDPRMFS